MLISCVQAAEGRYSMTPAPVIGYEPTYGAILGGALFLYPDQTMPDNPANRTFEFLAMYVTAHAGMVTSNYRYPDIVSDMEFSLNLTYSNLYDPWFGEGGETSFDPLYKIEQQSLRLRPVFSFPLPRSFFWSLFADYRQRKEQGVEGDSGLRLDGGRVMG